MVLLANLRLTLALRLAHYREKHGWKQHDLAAESGIKVGTIRNWEQQARWPRPEDIETLATALKVKPFELLMGPGDHPKLDDDELLATLKERLSARSAPAATDLPPEIANVVRILTENPRAMAAVQIALAPYSKKKNQKSDADAG